MKDTQKKKRLVLLDAHAIIHRAYHALPGFSSKSGEPTGALYGLVTMLMKIVTELSPDYIVACYDLPGKTFRHEAYESYKGTRSKTEDDLVHQLQRSRDVCTALGVPMYDLAGYEADDMLGTIVHQMRDTDDVEIIIASGDMDTLQLVRKDHVTVYTLRKGIKDTILYDEKAVKERFGFKPKLLIDYKGLRGDPSDNIPGIKGVGEKTAMTLVSQFGSLEDIYKTLEKKPEELKAAGITDGMIKKLAEGKEEAEFSKVLATIRHDAPIEFKLPETMWRENFDVARAEKLFTELDFRSLITRLRDLLHNGQDEQAVAEIIPEEIVPTEDVEKLGIALWLINSEVTHPTMEDVYQHTGTRDLVEAKKRIFNELEEKKLTSVYEHIELPLVPIIHRMKERGIMLDIEHLATLSKKYHAILNTLEKEIYQHAGREFNIKSPKQLGEILFDELKISGGVRMKKTAGGARSTRESELQKLHDAHPIIPAILSYRNFQKILSTYVDNIPVMADSEHRLHADFIQTGTTTGRFSSQNPNLQNIPASDEFRKDVRNGFIASPGYTLVACDYSQIELRVAAILSAEPNFVKVFQEGKDIHMAVAERVFGLSPDKVTPDMRRQAKVINFGIIYGMGVNALRENLGSDRASAQEFYNTYFERFPGLRDYLESVKTQALKKGYTETLFGRRRYFPALKSSLPFIRAQAERMAVNAPIQGTATADIIKLALIHVDRRIMAEKLTDKVFPLLQVHDELVYEVKDEVLDEVVRYIKDEMENIFERSFLHFTSPVPLVVNVATAKTWGNMK